MRITKRLLEAQVVAIKQVLNRDYELNNAPHYGGWQLTENGGSRVVVHRCSAREMNMFLNGFITALYGIPREDLS